MDGRRLDSSSRQKGERGEGLNRLGSGTPAIIHLYGIEYAVTRKDT